MVDMSHSGCIRCTLECSPSGLCRLPSGPAAILPQSVVVSRQSVIVAESASQPVICCVASARCVSGQSAGMSQQFYREGMASSALDNFVHVPVLYTPAFYVITELLQGFSWDHTMAVHCALLFAARYLFTAHYLLLTVHGSLLAADCSRLATCC